MPANWQGTCERCTGAVPARTSTFTTATRVVRRFRGRSVCIGMRSASTDWKWARYDYLYYHHHPATDLTTHSSPRTHLRPPGAATRLCRQLRAGLHRQYGLFSVDRTAASAALPFRVQSAELCFTRQTVGRTEIGSVQKRLADCYVDH